MVEDDSDGHIARMLPPRPRLDQAGQYWHRSGRALAHSHGAHRAILLHVDDELLILLVPIEAEMSVAPRGAILAAFAAEYESAVLGALVVQEDHSGRLAIRMSMFR